LALGWFRQGEEKRVEEDDKEEEEERSAKLSILEERGDIIGTGVESWNEGEKREEEEGIERERKGGTQWGRKEEEERGSEADDLSSS